MSKKNGFKLAALAVSIAFAMGTTAAMAATAPGQLPGHGKVTAGGATGTLGGTPTAPKLTVNAGGATVIDWGAGNASTDINAGAGSVAGFNIGKNATVNFTGTGAVLNIDSTGNVSDINGALNGTANVFVANANGIIVGPNAVINVTGDLGLIGATVGTAPFIASGTVPDYQGAGGDVTVTTGASIMGGGTVLVAGGGNVNVDMSAFVSGTSVDISAGRKNGSLGTDNPAATLAVTGATGGATIASLDSAGDAAISGVTGGVARAAAITADGNLTTDGQQGLTGAVTVGGDFTNTGSGDLTVNGSALVVTGTLNNAGKVTLGSAITGTATSTIGGLNNTADFDAGGTVLVVDGDVTNAASLHNLTDLSVVSGDVNNNGALDIITGGTIVVENGNFTNTANVTGVDVLQTKDTVANATVQGETYSISNTGTINGPLSNIDANGAGGTLTGGSFDSANGSLVYDAAAPTMTISAHDDLTLGAVSVNGAGTATPVSKTDPLTSLVLNANGVVENEGALWFTGLSTIVSGQVIVSADITGVSGSTLNMWVAGDADPATYDVRVRKGMTLAADTVTISGIATNEPSIILQGTLSGDTIKVGTVPAPVSDIFTGPAGKIVATGLAPSVLLSFTGAVKTAKYNNVAGNFRGNYLPISVVDPTAQLALGLAPVKYQTNGTNNGLSAVNVLVDGDVLLGSGVSSAPPASAVVGLTGWANTHLVLQSTGNIEAAANFYWPGYVYLGTIDSDANGPLAGTLGYGQITLNTTFSNVLPGDNNGQSGLHFMTQSPLKAVGTPVAVHTNANAWVNFPTDALTNGYDSGVHAADVVFDGGAVNNAGTVITYGSPVTFHTQAAAPVMNP